MDDLLLFTELTSPTIHFISFSFLKMILIIIFICNKMSELNSPGTALNETKKNTLSSHAITANLGC